MAVHADWMLNVMRTGRVFDSLSAWIQLRSDPVPELVNPSKQEQAVTDVLAGLETEKMPGQGVHASKLAVGLYVDPLQALQCAMVFAADE
jgi:hypothetical protein